VKLKDETTNVIKIEVGEPQGTQTTSRHKTAQELLPMPMISNIGNT
jgi:hypothetical protein